MVGKSAVFDYIVDNIMLTNYHTLSYVVSTLEQHVCGNAIVESFSQERDQLVLRLSHTEPVLILSCDRILNTLYLRPQFARARLNSADVLTACVGQTIKSVQIHPVDRVVMFILDSGKRIDARFFGAKANVVLVDENETIVDAFRDAKELKGKRAEYRSGELLYDMDAFLARLQTPQLATVATVMKEEFPTLGSTVIREVLHRANVPYNVGAMSIKQMHTHAIQGALGAVLNDLSRPKARVYLYTEGVKAGTPAAFSIIPLLHLIGTKEELFDDVHEAIRFYVSRLRSRESVDEQKRSIIGKLNQKLAKARRTVDAVEADLKTNARADEYQRAGELLMLHLADINKGEPGYLVKDENDEILIPLSKNMSPVQNAQRYFEKAKRSRTARQAALKRLTELQTTIAPGEELLAAIEPVQTKEDLKQFMSEYTSELEHFGIGGKSEEREQLPFRIFTVDGGFEVWAGKSSKNNDQLTLKYAKPDDLWFHARGAAGSHVVLKVQSGKGEPGKKAKEQAAGIAAYYSKMKNAKMVPVAMAEKKYVRKPKGAAPGSVTVEREKVIFAEPALPPEKHR
ncbi:MAG: DUF814 domain-containing protein [Bacteroidetes bacterium]|nr:DUF814 domain-containing protein [Bacteroidota bacterium]MCW5895878.1 DUF814 domain-containing protein [Bacteroidota bacterium]